MPSHHMAAWRPDVVILRLSACVMPPACVAPCRCRSCFAPVGVGHAFGGAVPAVVGRDFGSAAPAGGRTPTRSVSITTKAKRHVVCVAPTRRACRRHALNPQTVSAGVGRAFGCNRMPPACMEGEVLSGAPHGGLAA